MVENNGDVAYSFDVAYSLVETSDGGYALAGYKRNPNGAGETDCWLVKTDANGNVDWNQTYGEGGARSLAQTFDGGFALAGGEVLVKTDAYGNVEWNQAYGGIESDYFHSLVETSDRGYALAGETYSFGAGASDFWLVKTDEYGIPEFPSWTLMLLVIITITVILAVYKRKLPKVPAN